MTHDLIDRMVRQANPVPDVTVLELEPASVLELPRRIEMQTQDRSEVEAEPRRPERNVWLAIAALVAVIVGLVYFLRPQESTLPVIDQPVITATTTPAPATTAPEIVTTTNPPADAVPPELQGVWYKDEGSLGVTRLILRDNSYAWPGIPGAAGRASVTGDLVEFSDAPGNCPGVQIYRWSIEGTTLTFIPVEPDECNLRNGVFASRPFTRNSTGQPDTATTASP